MRARVDGRSMESKNSSLFRKTASYRIQQRHERPAGIISHAGERDGARVQDLRDGRRGHVDQAGEREREGEGEGAVIEAIMALVFFFAHCHHKFFFLFSLSLSLEGK